MKNKFYIGVNMSKEIRKQRIQTFIVVCVAIVVIWFCTWAGKHLSYNWFYEDLVIETIKEQVKPEYLKDVIK